MIFLDAKAQRTKRERSRIRAEWIGGGYRPPPKRRFLASRLPPDYGLRSQAL
jgi:hypothetical protein